MADEQEISAIEALISSEASYGVDVTPQLTVSRFEDGSYVVCEFGPLSGYDERAFRTAKEAAQAFVERRHARRLGLDYERERDNQPMCTPASDADWEARITHLIATVPGSTSGWDLPIPALDFQVAFDLRDSLALQDREALVRSLGAALVAESTEPDTRIWVSFLLKDLVSRHAVPFLAEAFCASYATPALQLWILDSLERAAFGREVRDLDLNALRECLLDETPMRHFTELLVTMGTLEAREMLAGFAADRATRRTLVAELVDNPEPWVDLFLADLLSRVGADPAVEQVIGERVCRAAEQKALACSRKRPADASIVRVLWDHGRFVTLLRLAKNGALAADAVDFLSDAPAPHPESEAGGELLARLYAAVASRRAAK